jgi:DHA2 family multidrug resistance protein
MGTGFGLFFAPLQTSAMSLLPKEKIAQAGGLISLVRQIGSSFGVALVTTLLTYRNVFHASVVGEGLGVRPDLVGAAAVSLGQAGTEGGLLPTVSSLVAPTQIVQQAQTVAYVQAISDIYLLVALCLALCVVPVLAMRLSKRGGAAGPGAV